MHSLTVERSWVAKVLSSGQECISSEAFRFAMAAVPAAIAVLTTNGRAGCWGITISALASVSDTPPTVLCCVNRCSRANTIIKTNGNVALNLLSRDQVEIADMFAGRTALSMSERFDESVWQVSGGCAPRLIQGMVVFEGDVLQTVEVATHTVFMIGVKRASTVGHGSPAIYHQRAYKTLPDDL